MSKHLSLVTLLFAVGCGGDDGTTSTTGSELSGTTTYRDAETNSDGTQRAPSSPPAQEADVYLLVKGTGQIPNVDPQCATDPVGVFEARYLSAASISPEEGYVAAFGSGNAQITTPSGCEIPDLTVGVVTDVVVRAELTINTQNCQTYCEAHARAEAEAQCGTSPAAAQCRGAAEADVASQCQTTCTTQANVIAAEVSLGASALGSLDATKLRGAAFGELSADLTFDRLEDDQGTVLGN